MSEIRPLRTFGRIKARTLKPRQAGLVNTLLPHLALPEEGALDVDALFGGEADPGPSLKPAAAPPAPTGGPLILEIGFGGGEHLAAQAAAHPDARLIGVEPFLNGVASCLRHIEESGVQNIRLHMGDARDVLARLPAASLDLCYILFPDPWPKLRHHKRRLIQPDFLSELARVLKPGAEVRFATDWANYAAWTLEHFTRDPRFSWTAERAADWRKAWESHVPTRYEQKRLGDCAPIWLSFIRAADRA
ncbi:MAG: tRNA (guanosine(46)-N7)-methyltransferase TrmB [Hyphomonadaceae bacterium]|nr:tRNA (guanosine(46)-N7)-methyltransferase TrmB [Hyphomonadaceae bacterium]